VTTPTPGSAGTPDRDDPTREIEVDHPTHALPGTAAGEATEPATAEAQPSAHTQVFGTPDRQGAAWTPADSAAPDAVPEPKRPSGPHLPPVLLGIVCLALAGLAIWQEVTDVQVDWGNVGPLGIVAIGALLVVLGLVGLLGSRRHSRP
jgi:hypothetical protein